MGKSLYAVMIAVALSAFACDTAMSPNIDAELHETTEAIYYGKSVDKSLYRSTVMLMNYSQYFCSATLITPNWVLTAAHCIDMNGWTVPSSTVQKMQVGVGQSERLVEKIYGASEIFVHPK